MLKYTSEHTIAKGAIQEAVKTDYTTALFATLQQMPLYSITAPLAIILIVACFVAAADSATYVLAMLTSNGDMNPDKKLRSIPAFNLLRNAVFPFRPNCVGVVNMNEHNTCRG